MERKKGNKTWRIIPYEKLTLEQANTYLKDMKKAYGNKFIYKKEVY